MKIKVVCEKTNLTDRTIRYYIEEGLISPSFTENYLGRKTFDFTEENVSELNDIAILRSFDFSIEEIRQILLDPSNSVSVICAVKDRISETLLTSQKKMSVISSLDSETAYNIHELACVLSSPSEASPSGKNIEPKPRKRMKDITKGILLFLSIWLPLLVSAIILIRSFVFYENPIVHHSFLILMIITLIPSLVSMLAPKIKFLRSRICRTALLVLCILCIPLSGLSAFAGVRECEHSPIAISHKIAATCTETGLTEGSKCSLCGTVLAKQEIIPTVDHTYATVVTEPTCRRDGAVTLVCHCTKTLHERTIFATEKHDFKKNGDEGYICSLCDMEVCEYGYANGDEPSSANTVRYYITGTANSTNALERTLVIFGSGELTAPQNASNYPFRESAYVDEVTTVIICDGITAIDEGAFEGASNNDNIFGNPFRSVKSFIVKGELLTLDPHGSGMSGIECDITYKRN